MSRSHSFIIAVLVAAAAVAGLVALTRSSAVAGEPSSSMPSAEQITYRLKRLDSLESSLRKQLAKIPAPQSVDRPPVVAVGQSHDESEDYDHDDEHEERNDRDD